jgi:hypothetical protein
MSSNVSTHLTAALLSALAPTCPAKADEVYHYGQLICEGNRALIRFATAFEGREPVFPPDPSEIPFTAAPADNNACRLSNGREVRFTLGSREQVAWANCEGGENSFISLRVDDIKVLARYWVQHSCFTIRNKLC